MSSILNIIKNKELSLENLIGLALMKEEECKSSGVEKEDLLNEILLKIKERKFELDSSLKLLRDRSDELSKEAKTLEIVSKIIKKLVFVNSFENPNEQEQKKLIALGLKYSQKKVWEAIEEKVGA